MALPTLFLAPTWSLKFTVLEFTVLPVGIVLIVGVRNEATAIRIAAPIDIPSSNASVMAVYH